MSTIRSLVAFLILATPVMADRDPDRHVGRDDQPRTGEREWPPDHGIDTREQAHARKVLFSRDRRLRTTLALCEATVHSIKVDALIPAESAQPRRQARDLIVDHLEALFTLAEQRETESDAIRRESEPLRDLIHPRLRTVRESIGGDFQSVEETRFHHVTAIISPIPDSLSSDVFALLRYLNNPIPPPQPPPQQTGSVGWKHSLRLLTYNTQFLPWIATHRPAEMDRKRARRMANAILRTDADVIALNEVFDEDARPILVQYLSPHYPYYVEKIDASGKLEDSGLMLFSRYPFTTLPTPVTPWPALGPGGFLVHLLSANNQGKPLDIGFVRFPAVWDTSDALANKGAGLARIVVPHVGKVINLVFTHMQASYDEPEDEEDGANVRGRQMAQIEGLLLQSLGRQRIAVEEVYVLGDLNIDGNLKNRKGHEQYGNLPEWRYHFDPTAGAASFFASVLRDGWAFGTSPLDVGQTGGDGFPFFPSPLFGTRLDYVLHNDPKNGDYELCLQHIRKAWEITDNNGTLHYSDHFGVFADFNLRAPHCSPLTAAKPALDTSISGMITNPGNMQWYRLDQPGTYSVKVSSAGPVQFSLYEATDLSRPLSDYFGKTSEWGRKFVVPEAPFYIRVFATDRNYTGTYTIQVHKHHGASPADSLVLDPFVPEKGTMPGTPLNAENAVWYEFRAQVAGGQNTLFPRHAILLGHTDPQPFDMLLLTGDTASFISQARQLQSPSTYSGFRRIIEHVQLPPKDYYVKILPLSTSSANHAYTLEWRTTLTYFIPRSMKCKEQTDDIGDDEMYFRLSFDDQHMPDFKKFGDFCDGDVVSLTKAMRRPKFVRRLVLDFLEVDDWNANDPFQTFWVDVDQSLKSGHDYNKPLWKLFWPQNLVSGEYEMFYRLSHHGRSKQIPGMP